MSEVEVNMPSPPANTDGRTDVRTKKLVADVDQLSVVDARQGDDRMATVGEILTRGVLRTTARHPILRTGDRTPLPGHVRLAVFYRDRGRCELCPTNAEYPDEWECDHIIPWSAGGSDDSTNLRVLCKPHNQQRSNHVDPLERPRTPVTWWCVNCYSEEWNTADGIPTCPTHAPTKCRVMRAYQHSRDELATLPAWHQRPRIVETWTIAYCAHCGRTAPTDRPL